MGPKPAAFSKINQQCDPVMSGLKPTGYQCSIFVLTGQRFRVLLGGKSSVQHTLQKAIISGSVSPVASRIHDKSRHIPFLIKCGSQ